MKESLGYLSRYIGKKNIGFIPAGLLLIICEIYLELKVPEYIADLARLVENPGRRVEEVISTGLRMLLCATGALLAAFLLAFISAKLSSGFGMRLRNGIYRKVMAFNPEEMSGFSIASLMTRSTNDVFKVSLAFEALFQTVFKAPAMALWAVLRMAGRSPQWMAAALCAVLVILVVLLIFFNFVYPKFRALQEFSDELNCVAREGISGIRMVRAYNASSFQKGRFEEANFKLTSAAISTQVAMAVMMPILTLVNSCLGLAIYWIGAYLVEGAFAEERMAFFSDMLVFSSYAELLISSCMILVMALMLIPSAVVSARRIREVLNTEIRIRDGEASKEAEIQTLSFQDVSFSYPGARGYALQNVSFSLRSGETLGLIGPNGCGKSTIANLILRFYEASEGEILVDGVNVRQYRQADLRRKIAYVPQKALLFSGTVFSNVVYGSGRGGGMASAAASGNATGKAYDTIQDVKGERETARDVKDVQEALCLAQAEEFVSNMPGGINSRIAQYGANLSGGQKQRISIARAFFRDAEILILDDAFSELDYGTALRIRQGMEMEAGRKVRTCLMISQRIDVVMHADRILVLEEGKVAGVGTHEELMKNCDVYRDIAASSASIPEKQ